MTVAINFNPNQDCVGLAPLTKGGQVDSARSNHRRHMGRPIAGFGLRAIESFRLRPFWPGGYLHDSLACHRQKLQVSSHRRPYRFGHGSPHAHRGREEG